MLQTLRNQRKELKRMTKLVRVPLQLDSELVHARRVLSELGVEEQRMCLFSISTIGGNL